MNQGSKRRDTMIAKIMRENPEFTYIRAKDHYFIMQRAAASRGGKKSAGGFTGRSDLARIAQQKSVEARRRNAGKE